MSRLVWLGCLALLTFCLSARAQGPGWFPFVLPWDDRSATITDVGRLNPAPAGKNGFLHIKDGRFQDGKGHRVRFLGVNLTFNANFPDKEDAKKVAARLRKFGVNIVRLHHMDFFHAPGGIFDRRFKDTQHLDPDQLDRLDYFLHQLKQHGIYTNLNLHVSRHYNAADGLEQTERLPDLGKVVGYFEPRMIELQKKYARDLLTRTNPYTRTKYAAEPALAVIELTNENTLLGEAWGSTLGNLPAPYRKELMRQWNAWLKARHRTTAALKRAWKVQGGPGRNLLQNADFTDGTKHWIMEQHQGAKGELQVAGSAPKGAAGKVLRVAIDRLGDASWHLQLNQAGLDLTEGQPYTVTFHARADRPQAVHVGASLDQADWHGVGLGETVKLGREWKASRLVFTATRTRKDHNRLVFGLGQSLGTVELAGLALRPGVADLIPKGASLEAGSIPPGRPIAGAAGEDWLSFLMEVEKRFVTTMRDYIHKDLGARALVVCSQASYGGLGGAWRESLADFTDMHAYWQHPEFPRRAWDPADWRITNTAMVRDRAGGTLPELARYRLAGRPFTVSEYNHPAPNDYQAECVPLLAAFAAWQDWDGIYLFDYNGDRDQWKSDRIGGFFAVHSNPAKMALLPAAALLFLRGDLAPAEGETRLLVPVGQIPRLLARKGPSIAPLWDEAGSRPLEALTQRLSVSFAPKEVPVMVGRKFRPGAQKRSRAVRWQDAGTDRALFTVDAPASKLVVGFVGGRTVELDGWRLSVPKDAPAFAALALSAADGKAVKESGSLLLTAVGRVENAGMGWNKQRTSVGRDWGKGPTRAQGIVAEVRLATGGKKVSVHALDGTGKRKGSMPVRLSDGQARFAIGPGHRTLWYEVVVER
jgi:hypothetical protein